MLKLKYEHIALLKFLKSEDDFRLLILGGIKTGKSALMYHLAELFHKLFPNKDIYVVNFPSTAVNLLPRWIKRLGRYEISDVSDCLLLFEESVLVAPARSWYTSFNKKLLQLISLSAHKRQRHIYVVQNARLIDPAVISLISALAIKKYNYINFLLERQELKDIVATAWIIYENNGITTDLDVKRHVVFFEITETPFLYRYQLPSFWTDELSRVWHSYSFEIRKQISETLTERIEELLIDKKVERWQDLVKYFPNAKKTVLKTLYYRVRKRLASENLL